ncbi:unnamed protein product [Clonostachys byssicola]|uniref:Uncharacterized protein n=1 Tax=Clonostachys byssicola TaxID=160290 RepID=A0A9N9U7S8_9HYPO|nr:unnamed protein product [Clonostachys byssicola]
MASPNPDLTDLVCASNFKDIDLTEQHGPLSQLLSQNVINIHVIFTQSGYDKPHAELALEVETEVQLGCLPNGCLPIKTNKIFLGMNSHLLTTYDDFGSSITLGTPYFHGALLHSLQFDVPAKRRTVREYLQTLRRKAPQDLGTFVNGGNYEIMSGVHSGVQAKPMGSRDFVTQCMIRWKRTTMISWKVKQGQVVGQRREAPLQFSDFITKPYRIENGITRCDGPEIPMEMGIYEDRVTKDFENSYAPINTSPDLSGGIVQFPTTLLHQPIDEILEELPIEQYPLIESKVRRTLRARWASKDRQNSRARRASKPNSYIQNFKVKQVSEAKRASKGRPDMKPNSHFQDSKARRETKPSCHIKHSKDRWNKVMQDSRPSNLIQTPKGIQNSNRSRRVKGPRDPTASKETGAFGNVVWKLGYSASTFLFLCKESGII